MRLGHKMGGHTDLVILNNDLWTSTHISYHFLKTLFIFISPSRCPSAHEWVIDLLYTFHTCWLFSHLLISISPLFMSFLWILLLCSWKLDTVQIANFHMQMGCVVNSACIYLIQNHCALGLMSAFKYILCGSSVIFPKYMTSDHFLLRNRWQN